MKVSIIVPLYYGKKYLNDIVSMINNNKKTLRDKKMNVDVELILINDSPKEKEEFENIQVYHNEKNMGIHQSRIRGLQYSTGEYIVFLDQDDKITDNYIFSQLENIGEADAIVCNGYYRNYKVIYDERKDIEITRKALFSRGNLIVSPGQVLIKKNSIPEEWKINVMKYSGADDFLLWLLMSLDNVSFAGNQGLLYTHVEHEGNTSFNWFSMINSLNELLNYMRHNKNVTKEEIQALEFRVSLSIDKALVYDELDKNWKKIHRNGRQIGEYFKDKGAVRIAIYGCGVVGRKVLRELQKDKVPIEYMVDQDINCKNSEVKVYCPDDDWPFVDFMIITPVYAYNEIIKEIDLNRIGNVVSIDKIIKELLNKDILHL